MVPAGPAPAAEQFIPVNTIRIGPIASIGTGLAAGWIDYMNLINDRDGGVHGVKLVWEECEFQYKADLAIECYERMKNRVPTGMPFYNTLSTPASYSLTDRAGQDKVPLINIGLGGRYADGGSSLGVSHDHLPAPTPPWCNISARRKGAWTS